MTAIETTADGVLLTVATPEGTYRIGADWVIAADGAHSTLRPLMGLGFEGRSFQDQFLICDIKMKVDRPTERWFWFDPPFNRGQSALLHKQADDVWRLDFQVGDRADREEEVRPENAARRVRAMLGEEVDFSFEWISLYRFHSRRMARFRHGRVLFAGDAAHQMSPFGARGGNSGIEDADNLTWKLDLMLRGLAPEALLDSYDLERTAGRGREPGRHLAHRRFHLAQEPRKPRLPRCHPGAGRDGAVRAPADQLGPALDARVLRRLAAQWTRRLLRG